MEELPDSYFGTVTKDKWGGVAMPFVSVFDHSLSNAQRSDRTESRTSTTIGSAVAVLIAAASLVGPRPSHAQEAVEGEQTTPRGPVEQIVVTGSRIGRADGFEAPTPVTVLGETELRSFASSNIADSINSLPVFAGSMTPGSAVANG